MYSKDEAFEILEQIATFGQPPDKGCLLFDYGNLPYLEKLGAYYIEKSFSRKKSSLKYVVGSYGSGKTHFASCFREYAEERNCISSLISLKANIDFHKQDLVFREIIKNLRSPGKTEIGIKGLMDSIFERIITDIDNLEEERELIIAKITDITNYPSESLLLPLVLQKILLAKLSPGDEREKEIENCGYLWISGHYSDSSISKKLGVPKISNSDIKQYRDIFFSLLQFIVSAGYQGSVIIIDEGDGLIPDPKKSDLVCSILLLYINEIVKIKGASSIFFFLITPSVRDEIIGYEALKGRIEPPIGGDFFSDNVRSPTIDLSQRPGLDPDGFNKDELIHIGMQICDFVFRYFGDYINKSQEECEKRVIDCANIIIQKNPDRSNIRKIAKNISSFLISSIDY